MESEPCVPLSLFGPRTLIDDEDFRLYMETARDELSTRCDSKCDAYSYNFFEDCTLKAMERGRYDWVGEEKPHGKGEGDPNFGYEGRASMASIGNFSTMQSLGPDIDFDSDEIPEIPFHKLGGTSLTNEDIVNYLQGEIEESEAVLEADDEPSTHIPYAGQGDEQSPGSLLSRRK